MTIIIWNKTIEIDDSLVKAYEGYGNKLDEAECRYLAKTGGKITPESTSDEIKFAIETGIAHTINFEGNIENIIKAIKKGNS